jgi:hypothetical protein
MDSLSRKAQIGRQSSRLRRQRSKEWKDYSSSDNEDEAIGVHQVGPTNGSGPNFGHIGLRGSPAAYDDPITHQYEEPRIVVDSTSSSRKNNFGKYSDSFCICDLLSNLILLDTSRLKTLLL